MWKTDFIIDITSHLFFLFQIWDTAGQERFKALRTPFYRGSDICLLAYAVDDKASFRALIQWREEFLKYYDVKADRFPFIVVGTKNDIPAAQRQVMAEEVSEWCQEHHVAAFIETSAKTSDNVYEAFALAVKQWQRLEKSTERDLRAQGQDIIDLTQGVNLSANTSRFCCIGGNNSGPAYQDDDDYPN